MALFAVRLKRILRSSSVFQLLPLTQLLPFLGLEPPYFLLPVHDTNYLNTSKVLCEPYYRETPVLLLLQRFPSTKDKYSLVIHKMVLLGILELRRSIETHLGRPWLVKKKIQSLVHICIIFSFNIFTSMNNKAHSEHVIHGIPYLPTLNNITIIMFFTIEFELVVELISRLSFLASVVLWEHWNWNNYDQTFLLISSE